MRNKVRRWSKSKNPYTSTEATTGRNTRQQGNKKKNCTTHQYSRKYKNKRADKQKNYLRKQSPGSQHHSQKRHGNIFKRSTLHFQESTLISSIISLASFAMLLKIQLFRAPHKDHTTVCQIKRNSFLVFLFFVAATKQSKRDIKFGGIIITTSSHLKMSYHTK
jgi:hypothetical protein